MRGRAVRIVALSLLLLATSGAPQRSVHQRPRPNIVVVIADDLGWADVGYRGSAIATPNIDSLAAGGVRFESFYAHPWCSPTRAAFLTGRFPPAWSWQIPGNRVDSEFGIDASEYTIAARFRDAGYTTALIGKWHQGTRPESHPNRNGFDYFYGFLGGYIGFYYKASYLGPYDWQRNGVEIFDELEYATTLLGEDASRFVRDRDRSRPFFLALTFNAPHFPQQAPQDVVDEYASRTGCSFPRCEYMAQVDVMDREIGRLVRTLEDEGIRENTLILFFSDNGGANAFGGDNTPLRGEKLEAYEGGIRVPAFLNWPGVVPAGQTRSQRILVSDVYATLEAAAGLPQRAPTHSRDASMAVVWNTPLERGPIFFMNLLPGSFPGSRSRALIAGDWKYVLTEPDEPGAVPTVELFLLRSDPNEQRDLARGHAQLAPIVIAALDRMERQLLASPPPRAHGRRLRLRPGMKLVRRALQLS